MQGRFWVWFHGILVLVWVALTIATMVQKTWRESIPWLQFVSLYAIVVTHGGAWQAARTERNQDAIQERGTA